MNNSGIRLVKNKDVDYGKWDSCVARSVVPLVYAQSHYLDLISPGWDALILGDYDYVMPLNIKKKLGFKFLLQPIFAQQHGIFPDVTESVQHIFLNYIKQHFRYVSIQVNSSHSVRIPDGFLLNKRTNFILKLSSTYEELKNNYSKHARRQIKKANDNKVFVIKGLQTKEYMDLKNLATENKLPKPSMHTLQRLIEYGTSHGKGMIYAAYSQENILCSAAFFLNSGHRVIYLNAASSSEGKANRSMYQIVDQFIREHSGSGLILDFEGSSIPGIARFYSGFGAQTEYYNSLKLNRLPIPLRWLIK